MDWRSVEARDRGNPRPSAPTPPPSRRPRRGETGRGLLLPALAAVAGLGVVAGAALTGPWRTIPRGPVEPPAPRPEPTFAGEEVTDLAPPPEQAEAGGVPLMLYVVVAALLLLFLALRAFLNRATMARGATEGIFDTATGAVGEVDTSEPEPDLPALRRGVAAARRLLDDYGEPDDAVIAAWLELERAAASSGVDRAPAHTPTEFTTAVLDATRADPDATRTLLGLYHRARFAPHAVLGPADVTVARQCLERIAESWGTG